jgi:hypothetical protein
MEGNSLGLTTILSWHLPEGYDKPTRCLRTASVPIKIFTGHFPNTSCCHTNLLGLYKLLFHCLHWMWPIVNDVGASTLLINNVQDNQHKTYFTDKHDTRLTAYTVHNSSHLMGFSSESTQQITECCTHFALHLKTWKFWDFCRGMNAESIHLGYDNESLVCSSLYFEGTYCLHLPTVQGP